ncbi:MAG: cysteine--tRNA ligase [Actinomycetota bacterium]
MALRLFDSATSGVRPFEAPPVVRMYTCGITPYDATHIGHAATFLAFDVLYRHLLDSGYEVRFVRNVTDVDDSLLARARELGIHYLDLAAGGLAQFDADLAALGLLPPTSEPRATSAIGEIRRVIGSLLDQGLAYATDDGWVYFAATEAPTFGELSGLDREHMLEIGRERGELVDPPGRRHPLDTVLWQPSEDDEPVWEARWGDGRPGWHVECTSLALSELGAPIDLHGGGSDLLHPHHEYERAQADAVVGGRFVRHWMHVGMVTSGGEKMAKSAGNLVFVGDLLERWPGPAIRLAVLDHHYRSTWEWRADAPAAAAQRLETWWTGERSGVLDPAVVRRHLDDDLDVPGALAAIDEAAAAGFDVTSAAERVGFTPP